MTYPPRLQRSVRVKDAADSVTVCRLTVEGRGPVDLSIQRHTPPRVQSPTAPQARPQSFTPLPGDQVGVNTFPLHFSALSLLRTGWCQEHVRSQTSLLGSGRTMSSAAWDLLCCRANVDQDGLRTLGISAAQPCKHRSLVPSQRRSGHGGGWPHCDQWFQRCQEPEDDRARPSRSKQVQCLAKAGSAATPLTAQHISYSKSVPVFQCHETVSSTAVQVEL